MERKIMREEFKDLMNRREKLKRKRNEIIRIQQRMDTEAVESSRFMRVKNKRANCI